ncbi:MAG: hypothetical protein ACRYGP_05635, partial [Janthinobacterium lividum]
MTPRNDDFAACRQRFAHRSPAVRAERLVRRQAFPSGIGRIYLYAVAEADRLVDCRHVMLLSHA